MKLSTVVFLSLVLCGMGDVHVGDSLESLTIRVEVVEQDLSLWKYSNTKSVTKLTKQFKVWKESLKKELTSTILPSLLKPLVEKEITNILTEDDIGHRITGQVRDEVHSLKDNVQYIKTRLRAITRDLRHVERERDTYRKSVRKEQSELTKDIQALQIQVNQTVTIDGLLETNKTLTGLTQDFRTLNTSCVVTEREIKSYREGLQEIRRNVSSDIQSLNIQVNQSIDDQFYTNQTLADLTQDFRTLNTSCVLTEREIKSYREGLQEMKRNISLDIQSLNIQLNQAISDQFDTNQTLAGLKQDFRTLNTSCVLTEREIKSYREGLQEMKRNISLDIQSLNIQLNQAISDQFDTNQTLAGLKQDFRTLNTSCVLTEREIKSYREGLQEMKRNISLDIQSLNIQLNQAISDQFDTNQTLADLTQDVRTLNTSCCGMRKEIKELSPTTYPGTTEASTDPSRNNTSPPTPVTTQDLQASTTDASENLTPTKTVPPTPVTTQDSDTQATPSPAAGRDLYDASRDGDLERVKRILAEGHVDINYRRDSMTPVMAAAWKGHSDVVEFLVGRGADVSLVDRGGYNVLHWACAGGHLETVKLIVSMNVVDINSRGKYSRTPVMRAAWKGHSDVVQFLVGRGADMSLVDRGGNNVLYFACAGGDLETVKLILSMNVVDINARNNDGKTAADMARGRHQRVVDLLVSRGAH
ncbi:uncharacterized protein [Haliotis asinina]|uniref:uncharacterized protein n=1 Tax=Haliotis asinina TaxID=109174 RepID=UPI003531C143